jgi:hypothetical protein
MAPQAEETQVKLRIFLDGIPHEIDSTDPELIARWIREIFGRLPEINPGTLIELQVYPSVVYDETGQFKPDWSADSRIIAQHARIKSPRELVAALSKQLDEAEALHE